MNPSNLPPDLAAFEAELQALPRSPMPQALRQRVMADLQVQLARQSTGTTTRDASQKSAARWWFAAAAAAVALLWLNLSWMTARGTGDSWPSTSSHSALAGIDETQAAIATLLPDVSPSDSQLFALTLYSGTHSDLLPASSTAAPVNHGQVQEKP